MQEVLPGVFHWKAVHPAIHVEVHCHFIAGSGTAIDPLPPAEGIEWFDERGVQRVVLSNHYHLRGAAQLAERFECPILCQEAGLHEFEDGPEVEGFAFGDRLAEDLVALEMDSICPEDTVLLIESGGGALLFADSVINEGGLGFVSDHHLGEEPERVRREVRAHCRTLLEQQDFEHLLFAHGDPLIGGGRDALRAFAETEA